MSNFEQIPINQVPENSDVEKKEDEIKNEEKVETELNQESKNIEAEDQNDDIFEKTESVNDRKEGENKKKSWLRRQFNNAVTATVIAGSIGHVADAFPKSAEAEFTSGEKNKTEQLVSAELQKQKEKIINPNDVLKENLWLKNRLVDSLGYVSLSDFAHEILEIVSQAYFIDYEGEDAKEAAREMVEEVKRRLIPGMTYFFMISAPDDAIDDLRIGQISQYEDNTGTRRNEVTKSNKTPDKIAIVDIENNLVRFVFATKTK